MTASASRPPREQIPDLATLNLELATPRLLLKPFELRHADELFPHTSDPDLTRFMSWDPHKDVEETRAFIAKMIEARAAKTDVVWAIEHDGVAIGTLGLHGITWQRAAWRVDRAEIGYWIGKPFWGQGLMTEAARAAVGWAFETLGLHKLTIGCIEDNVASKRIIEKLGFRFLGVQEDDVWRFGRWWNHLRFEQTAAEWGDDSRAEFDVTRTLRFSRRPHS
jgi:[ribosomal protein S5]-alanine N-acetyltransferase